MAYDIRMKFVFPAVFAALAIAVAAALAVFASDPRTDTVCALERIRDAMTRSHAGWQCLHYAAARGDLRAVAAALDAGASRDARTKRGQTPLILAAANGRLAVTQALIRRQAELEARDGRNGFTALHWAAQRYHPAVARALLAAGARVDAQNKWQQTPLWQASWQDDQGNTEIAHILVAAGADIHKADNKGNTPLLMAALAGHRPMVRYLLELGADMQARNDEKRTALFQAVTGGHEDVVRLLLARGADPNNDTDGTVPLQQALVRGERRIADLLQANGATGYRRYAADAALQRGQKAYDDGNFDTALRAFAAAIALQPDDPAGYYWRGLTFIDSNAPRDAEADLAMALRLDRGNNDARTALARLYVEQGQYKQAVGALGPLLDNQPDNARALFMLGQSHHGLGENARASTLFARACDLGFEPACAR